MVRLFLIVLYLEPNFINELFNFKIKMNNCAIFVPEYTLNCTDVNKAPLLLTDRKLDLEYFELIYKENINRITKYIFGYVNNNEDAKNIAHDVFITFWKNRQNIDLNGNITSYLYVSARNMCLNYLRKKDYATRFSSETKQNKIDYLNRIALESTHSISIYENEVEKIIFNGINQMKPKVRKTFILSRINGLKNREIAKTEGVAESTIEARISSALIIMRRLLKDYL